MSPAAPGPLWVRKPFVLAGLGLLGAIAVLGLGYMGAGCLCDSKEDSVKIQVAGVAENVTRIKVLRGAYPASLGELTQGAKPLLKPENLRDPWKHGLEYRVLADHFELCSAGPDAELGTLDDTCYGREVR